MLQLIRMRLGLQEFVVPSSFHSLSRRKNMNTKKTTKTNEQNETKELGPNGYRVGFTENGDLVEWVPDEEHPGQECPWLLRRNDKDIDKTYNELWDKVWWNRHQVLLQRMEQAQKPLPESQMAVIERAKQAAKRIEDKYGKENLGWSDFEWGLLSGRMSALRWVKGAEWDESLDT